MKTATEDQQIERFVLAHVELKVSELDKMPAQGREKSRDNHLKLATLGVKHNAK